MFDVTTSGIVNLASLGTFDNVSTITFTANLGNVRIDDLDFGGGNEPAPIPLPAGGVLLAGALGLFGLLRRRKAA